MTPPAFLRSTCPECSADLRHPEDATEHACACGWRRVKVRVVLPLSGDHRSEGLWARPLGDDQYAIDNVPVRARGLHADDVVRAAPPAGRPEEIPHVVEVLEPSGRETVWVRCAPEDVPGLLADLPKAGTHERSGDLLALDLPGPDVPQALGVLEERAVEGALAFERSGSIAPGRFDDLRQDLLGQFFLRVRRDGSRGAPADDETPPAPFGEAAEAFLWEGLGWAEAEPPVGVRLRMCSSAEVRARSAGVVSLPRTIDPRRLALKHGGLFAPEVWGHAVAPGPEGLRACYGDLERAERALVGFDGPCGHLELPVAVQHPWFPELWWDALPVLPPGCRPVLVRHGPDGGSLRVAELNYLYMTVLDRALEVEVTTARLQEAVNALFDNETWGDPFRLGGAPLTSLRRLLGRQPGRDLADLGDALRAGRLRWEGPWPRRVFFVVRALEAMGVAVTPS